MIAALYVLILLGCGVMAALSLFVSYLALDAGHRADAVKHGVIGSLALIVLFVVGSIFRGLP